MDTFFIMKDLKGLICLLSVLTFMGCGNDKTNIEAETYFTKKVQSKMEKSIEFETDFTDLVKFKWNKVCFDAAVNTHLNFLDEKNKKENHLNISKMFYIPEGYVKGSPVKEIYKKGTLSKINCWKQGTQFVIKKMNNIQNKFEITIKE